MLAPRSTQLLLARPGESLVAWQCAGFARRDPVRLGIKRSNASNVCLAPLV